MNSYEFSSGSDDSLVVVECYVNGYELRFMVDTGASITIMDLNSLFVFGGTLVPQEAPVILETASGHITAKAAEVASFQALGIRHDRFALQVYDFMQHSIITEIDGILGLDFFAGRKLCIDFPNSAITLS